MFIDREAREIMHLVASVCPSVRLGVLRAHYTPLQRYMGYLCTRKAQYAPLRRNMHHGAQGRLYFLKNSGDADDFLFWWFIENTHKICPSGKCPCGSHWHTRRNMHHQGAICTMVHKGDYIFWKIQGTLMIFCFGGSPDVMWRHGVTWWRHFYVKIVFFALFCRFHPKCTGTCEIWICEWKAGMDGSMTQLRHEATWRYDVIFLKKSRFLHFFRLDHPW